MCFSHRGNLAVVIRPAVGCGLAAFLADPTLSHLEGRIANVFVWTQSQEYSLSSNGERGFVRRRNGMLVSIDIIVKIRH